MTITRETGILVSTGARREARSGTNVRTEIRQHDGAGLVEWAEIDHGWVIISAVGPCVSADE